jgi:hypothetical protein
MMNIETVLQMNPSKRDVDAAHTAAEDSHRVLEWKISERLQNLGRQQTSMALNSFTSRIADDIFTQEMGAGFTSWMTLEGAHCPHCRALGYQIRYSVGRACRVIEGRCFHCGSSRRSVHEPGKVITGPR